MDTGDFLRVVCEFTLPGASNPAINVWDFEVTTATATFDLTSEGFNIISEVIATRYTPLADLISNQAVMTAASIRAFADPTDGFDTAGVLFTGTALSGMMPPFVSMSIEMIRANYAMRNGRKAIPGVASATLDSDGGMDDAAIMVINTVTTDWAENDLFIEGNNADITLSARIVRVPATPGVNPTVFSRITGYGNPKFGTQNGRKP